MTATASIVQLVAEEIERGLLNIEVDMAVNVHGHLNGAVSDNLHHPASAPLPALSKAAPSMDL